MAKPQPEPIDPSRLTELAEATIARAKFPQLATMDGDQPRLRPVSPVRTDGFTVYIANLRDYHKTNEIEANPKVELCYLDPDHNQVRITGKAALVEDPDLIAEIWESNPLLASYLGSPENPQFMLYRINPERVRYMREWALEYYEVQ